MCQTTCHIFHCSNCDARVAEPRENFMARSVHLCNDPNCEHIDVCHVIIPGVCAACTNRPPVTHGKPTDGPETQLTNGFNTDPGEGPSASGSFQRSTTRISLANTDSTSRLTAPMAVHGHNSSISTQASSSHSRTDSLNSNPVFYIPEGDEAGDIPRALLLRGLQREHEENERRRQREREDTESRRSGSD